MKRTRDRVSFRTWIIAIISLLVGGTSMVTCTAWQYSIEVTSQGGQIQQNSAQIEKIDARFEKVDTKLETIQDTVWEIREAQLTGDGP